MIEGYRESQESWRDVLRTLRRRGSKTCGCSSAMAAWGSGRPSARSIRRRGASCVGAHKMLNVLDKLPQRLQPEARTLVRDVYTAPTRDEADARIKKFALRFERDYPRAVASLVEHQAELLTYYDFPREHWRVSARPIPSSQSSIQCDRARATRRMRKAQTGLYLVFQLVRRAEQRWRRIDAPHLVAKVLKGVRFVNGMDVRESAKQRKGAA